MNIQDALKETGMAHHLSIEPRYYLAYDSGGTLGWWLKGAKGRSGGSAINRRELEDNNWQPYHAELTKCPACIDADEVRGVIGGHYAIEECLKKYCTCKGGS